MSDGDVQRALRSARSGEAKAEAVGDAAEDVRRCRRCCNRRRAVMCLAECGWFQGGPRGAYGAAVAVAKRCRPRRYVHTAVETEVTSEDPFCAS